MKNFILMIILLLAGLSSHAQTSTLPSSLGEIQLFKNAKAPFTIVLEPNYPKDTVIIELWDSGKKVSDTTTVVVSGDTIKFTLAKSQVKALKRESYFYLRFKADTTEAPEFGGKLLPSFGIGVPNISTKTVSAPPKGIVRVSLVGDASVAMQAANKAKAYGDSTKIIFNTGAGVVSTRKKFGKLSDLKANTENVKFFEIAQKDSVGTFVQDPSDAVSISDSVLLIVDDSGRRFKRQFTGPANVKWWGAKGDSSTNDTQAINRAMNNPRVKHLFFPRGVYRISLITLGKGNKTIEFEAGSIIEGTGNMGTFGFMWLIKSTSNVNVIGNGVLFRDNQSFYSPTQERGAIRIASCNNVTISDVNVKETPGDGFKINAFTFGVPSKNINLIRCNIDDVWRNGISIIDVIGCRIRDCSAINIDPVTIGTAPHTGLYMEPNDNSANLQDIVVDNFFTTANGGGISIVPVNLDGNNRIVSITINNPHDIGSAYGIAFGAANGALEGKITVNNGIWDNQYNQGVLVYDWHYLAPRIEINNPTILNPRTNGFASACFLIIKESDGGNYPIGNVHITNPIVRKITAGNFAGHVFYYDDERDNTTLVQNCTITDPVEFNNIDSTKYMYLGQTSLTVQDRNQLFKRKVTASQTINGANYARYLNNEGASGSVTFTLGAFTVTPLTARVTFEVKAAQNLIITPTSSTIIPYTSTAGQSIQSEVVGSTITLDRVDATTWKVSDMKGVWTGVTQGIFSALPIEVGSPDSNQDFTTRYNKAVYYYYNATGNRTVTLPPAAKSKGVPFYYKKVSNNAATITITTADGSTIENAASKVLSTFMEGYLFMSDGVKYWIIN